MYSSLFAFVLIKVATATLDPKELLVEKKIVFVPPLEEVAHVLGRELKKDFEEVEVDVVDCPDLREPPFMLANAGLSGNPRIVDIGGAGHMGPYRNWSKIYDLTYLPSLVDLESAFVIGATIGCHPYMHVNSETIVNIDISNSNVNQLSRSCKIAEDNESYVQKLLPKNETRYSFLGNFFVSEGKPGKVLKVHLRKRLGTTNFILSMIRVLKQHYGDRVMGLGGTFLLQQGNARQHLMPHDFPKETFNSLEDASSWFKYYNMSAPLIGVGAIATGSHDLDFRDHHFHTFSNHGDCGHYYIDTTPETAEYVGYFNIAEFAYRIDRPQVSST